MSIARSIVGIYPELVRHGGVQRLSRHVASVLDMVAQERGLAVHHLSLLDGDCELQVGDRSLNIRGFSGDRKALVKAAWGLASNCGLVYTTHVYQAPLAFAMKLRNRRMKVATHLHGIEVWKPMQLLRQVALRSVDLATLTSADTGGQARRTQRFVAPRMEVLHPALDPGFAVDGDGIEPSVPMLLTVARLDKNDKAKGIDVSIQAFAEVAKDTPQAVYTIVGDGNDRERLESIARDHSVADRVVFTGKVSDEELRRLYRQARAFALPSGKEGFGIVFLEAMAAGLPCIGGNAGGTPEIIVDGETGRLVAPGDLASLTAAMSELLGDAVLAKRMGSQGRDRVIAGFQFGTFSARLRNYLGPLLP